MKKTTRFKQLILAPEILMLLVAHDALCAKIAERAGFQAISCAGYANSAAMLGKPDVDLLTLTEMVDCAWRIADAVDIPVFADGDTGHGNTTNVSRTVKQLEKAGVAALFIEDQVAPKRCGHMVGKRVIPTEEMIAKITPALAWISTQGNSPNIWRSPPHCLTWSAGAASRSTKGSSRGYRAGPMRG